MPEATTFLMVGSELPIILGFLNSHLSEYYFSTLGTTTGMGTVRWKKYTIEQLPVVMPQGAERNEFLELIHERINSQCPEPRQQEIEREIDAHIAKSIGLTAEENDFIQRRSLAQ
ncbi:hypothetical protein EHS19_10550 [Bifidobacterium jacchi]|uniref:Uncharacterized protein n=1 Tax=Bifidobacterium jacchi TaxID=2490545 RepID=A0A5N5RC20_9BIFI|nr:hypothetical protein EHS19_10550 [Bifidobacterium jacchi]